MKWFRLWTDVRDDVKMLQLSDYEFRMWVYLMSYASDVNSLSGDLQITFKLLSLHFHQRFNLFSRAIETFQRLKLISLSDTGNITLNNWKKRQFKSDDAYARVKKFRDVHQEKKRFRNGNETAPDTDTDTDTDKRLNTFLSESSQIRLSNLLYEKILSRNPKLKKPNLQAWAKHIDLMQRVDKRTTDEIEKIIHWCQADGFWQNNILSTKKLREKYDQLFLKMNGEENGNRPNTNRNNPHFPAYPARGGQRQPAELPEEVVSLLRAAEQAAVKTKAARDSGEKPG